MSELKAQAFSVDWSLVKRIVVENAYIHRWRYALALMLMLVAAGSTALIPWIMGDLIDEVFIDPDWESTLLIAVLFTTIFAGRGFIIFVYAVVLGRVSIDIVNRHRIAFWDHVLMQEPGFIKLFPASALLHRFSAGIGGITNALNVLIASVGRDITTLIGLVISMFFKDTLATLLAMVTMPAIILLVRTISRRARQVSSQLVTVNTHSIRNVSEMVAGLSIIRLSGAKGAVIERAHKVIEDLRRREYRLMLTNSRVRPVIDMLVGLSFGVVIIYGGITIANGTNTPGDLVAYLTALMLAYGPAKTLVGAHVRLQTSLVEAANFYQVLDHKPKLADSQNAKDLILKKGSFKFTDVHFSYQDDTPALKGVSFTAEGSKTTAIVGPSGGGKTTLFQVLLRLYKIDKGTVELDGQNLQDITTASLYDAIGYVPQNSTLFSGSIAENIALGKDIGDVPGDGVVTMAQIEQAAKKANAHDFISALPRGYETELEELGQGLSGGQKQRLNIARAFLKNPPIMMLDEATSALDSRAEAEVQIALERLMKERTTLVIAHRLSTIQNADKIVVMDDGCVMEQGTHQELIRADGIYAQLYELQRLKNVQRA